DDSTLYNYVLEAYGFNPKVESKSKIRDALVSDLSDPSSFANLQSDARYRTMAAAFNFGTDGSVLQPLEAQADSDELATIQLYNTRVGPSDSDQAQAVEDNAYYHNTIIKMRSLDDFLADKRLVTYVLKAYGLDGETVTSDVLSKVLTSDPMDKDTFVSKLADSRFRD